MRASKRCCSSSVSGIIWGISTGVPIIYGHKCIYGFICFGLYSGLPVFYQMSIKFHWCFKALETLAYSYYASQRDSSIKCHVIYGCGTQFF
jgi:hypothetical protein